MNESDLLKFKVDIVQIKNLIKKIGPKYPQIASVYLFGSSARGDVEETSDIDILFITKDNAIDFFLTLSRDEDYQALENWAFEIVEGGLSPLICSAKELAEEFDTLIEKIAQEGIHLYGANLNSKIFQKSLNRKKKVLIC